MSLPEPPTPPMPEPTFFGPGTFGLAPVKSEGATIAYDLDAGPGLPLTRLQRLRRRLGKVGDRLRWLPQRLWWAAFGSDYYD
jgi:hypothetical protein